jgi:hypothetical protein
MPYQHKALPAIGNYDAAYFSEYNHGKILDLCTIQHFYTLDLYLISKLSKFKTYKKSVWAIIRILSKSIFTFRDITTKE